MSTMMTRPVVREDTPRLRYAVAPITNIDFRDASANHDGSWTISGYAAVFDQETTLYDGNYVQVRESIAPTAFDSVLRNQPLVHLNVGHDMNRSVAATDVPAGQIGSLILSSDQHGLRFLARVDRNDPDAQALAVKMSRGIARQASFAFTIGNETMTSTQSEDGRDVETFRILEVRSLMDVCVTPQGAYQQTEAMLRSMSRQMGDAMMPMPADGGSLDPAEDPMGMMDAAEPDESFAEDVGECVSCLADLLSEYASELAAISAPLEEGETVPSTMAEEVGELLVMLANILASASQPASVGGSSSVTAYTKPSGAGRERELALARLRAKARMIPGDLLS